MVRVRLTNRFGQTIWAEAVKGITMEQVCELSKVLTPHSPGRSWYNDDERNFACVPVKLGEYTLDVVPGETIAIECCG